MKLIVDAPILTSCVNLKTNYITFMPYKHVMPYKYVIEVFFVYLSEIIYLI